MPTKKKTLAPTPILTEKERQAMTVAQFLRRIKKLVLEEPQRLNMTWWVSRYRNQNDMAGVVRQQPACGTVGCIAGWGAILLRRPDSDVAKLSWIAATDMQRVIGADRFGLFSGVLNSCLDSPKTHREGLGAPGTLQHAQAVARRIETFIKVTPAPRPGRSTPSTSNKLLDFQ